MNLNVGRTDRWLRVALIAPVLVVTALLVGVTTVAGVVALVLAAVMLATGLTGFCPLYRVFGISTRSTHQHVR